MRIQVFQFFGILDDVALVGVLFTESLTGFAIELEANSVAQAAAIVIAFVICRIVLTCSNRWTMPQSNLGYRL